MREFAPVVLCIALLLQAAPLTAQQVLEPAPGTRIRITAPSHFVQPQVGTLQVLVRDTLFYLDLNAAEQAIPLISVERLEVSEGVRSNSAPGVFWGFLVGAGLGGGAVAIECRGSHDCPPSALMIGVGGGGLVGAVVGAIAGSTSRREYWRVVPLSPSR